MKTNGAMKTEYYRQCRMSRGNSKTIAYIDAEAAKVGNIVELLSLDGEFWRVDGAGEKVQADFVKENERNYKLFQDSLQGNTID